MHLQPFTSRRKCSVNFILGLSSHLLMQKYGCKKSICPVSEQSVCQEEQLPVLVLFWADIFNWLREISRQASSAFAYC